MRIFFIGLAAAVLSLTFLFSVSFTRNYAGDISEPEIDSPSDLHRIMGETKARNLRKSRDFATAVEGGRLYNQEYYDVTFYRIRLEIDADAEQIVGDVEMSARSLAAGLDTIEVDFFDNLTVDSVYSVSGLLDYLHADNKITVKLDRPYNDEELFEFSIAYHGHPIGYGLEGFSFDTTEFGDNVVSSLSEPMSARSWWPCKDRPDDKADSLDIFVTCDTAYFCASNGTLIDTVRHGDGTWTFNYEVRYPIAAYLFSIAVSNYVVWNDWYHYGPADSMPIIHHVYPGKYSESLAKYYITPYALEVLSGLFGEYPFIDEKYGHANFEWGGAMENQTVSSMSSGFFGFREEVIVHELAHQWWGNMITCNSWHEIWLNEGFASYSEALYYEVKDGRESYFDYMRDMKYFNGGAVYIYDTTDVWNIFSLRVYDKGAWIVHMLRHVVGDSAFFAILSEYRNSLHQYGNATSEDFKNICEAISGMELDYFFDQWLYGFYFPNYYRSYFVEPDPAAGGYYIFLNLRQAQSTDPTVFTMPVDLVFFSDSVIDTFRVFNDLKDTVYIIKLDNVPDSISLDPDEWILRRSFEEVWSYHQIPFGLDTARQYEAFLDSIIVRGGSGDNRFRIVSGTLPSGLDIDSLTGEITGTPTEFGQFAFEIEALDVSGYAAETTGYSLTVLEGPGQAGDVNNDDVVNLLDITFLISYLYKDGPIPENPAQADPDQSCVINILDITYIIANLYKGGPELLWGCAVI